MGEKNVRSVALSHWASKEIHESWKNWCVGTAFIMVVVCVIVFLVKSPVPGDAHPEIFGWACLAVFAVMAPLAVWRHIVKRIWTYRYNYDDWHRSARVRKMFDQLAGVPSTEFSVQESRLPGTFRPFRVEHMVSQNLRGTFSGYIDFWSMSFSGEMQGVNTPNLLDTSTILFLQNEQDATLRVLVPTPKATRELLAATLKGVLGRLPKGTFTRDTLNSFTMDDGMLVAPISHPQEIDALDADCQKEKSLRRTVGVLGTMVQPGVAIASALEVDGQRHIFFPSGFFRQLTDGTGQALGFHIQSKAATEAIS